uniref:G-protein coupled receptors family 1 profile domain-containing protein n=1 Tax=Plectus sambesii TaxID=2011161 RepID=A0A914XJQ6_9BILA
MVWTGEGTIDYVMIGLCAVCLPINLLFLAMLIKYRDRSPLNSSFFHLCMHLTIADSIMMLFSNLVFKFPMYGWFPAQILWDNKHGLLPKVPVVGVWYFSHAQAFGIITLALNRFTASWWPIKHREFWWTQSHMNIALLLQWLLPIAIVAPIFFADFTLTSNNATGGILFVAESMDFHRV